MAEGDAQRRTTITFCPLPSALCPLRSALRAPTIMNCYVLTGGRSSRMGRSKRALFFDRVAAAARPVFDDVIALDWEEGGKAPIFGVARALRNAQSRAFILAVDYPLITSDVLRFLRDRG